MSVFQSNRGASSVAPRLGGVGWVLTLLAVLGSGLLPAPGALAQVTPAPADYVIHELPTLGGDDGAVLDINGAGAAVGWSELRPGDDEAHATLWAGGEPIDLGTLGGNESVAIDINDAGVVVGQAETADGDLRAVIWRDGTIGGLGTLGSESSSAHAINAEGTIIGSAETADGEEHAFLWRSGVMTDLGTLGGPNSDALHITEDGVAYGTADAASGRSQAARWHDGAATGLGTLGGDWAFAMAANQSGVVVGYATQPEGAERALTWHDGSLAEIDPDDPTPSVAVAVNDAGTIAGSLALGTPEMRAVIWRYGERILLPGLADGGTSGAFGISSEGIVGGNARDASGRQRPVLWVPATAPAPAALVGAPQAATPAASASPVSLGGVSSEATREAQASDDAAVSNQFVIESFDIYFEPAEITIPANTDVTINLPNNGAAPHNFSIDALDISVDIAPGETEEVTFTAPEGEYEYYCNVPGHKEAGMVGALIVAESAGSTGEAPAGVTPESKPATQVTQSAEATAEGALQGGPGPAAASEPVGVASLDIYFEPSEVAIPANTDVTFVLPNEGTVPHNFSIDALGIDVDQAPGETYEVVINAPAGSYEFYCNVPGHTEAGMVGTLIVREDVPTAPALAATPAAPAASPTPAPRSFVWDQVDVTVRLHQDGSFRVTERDRVAFGGGPFRTGYREIPLARIERVDDIWVGEVDGASVTPYRFVAPEAFSPGVPHTYTWRVDGPNLRIDWSFPETTSAARTFQIGFDASGALRVYADADSPYQQISWIGIDEILTATAPVNEASLTFVLPRAIEPSRTIIQGPGSNRSADHTVDGQTWVWRASDLGSGESLEASLRFPPLVAAEAPSWQEASDRAEGARTEDAAVATPVPLATPVPQATPVAGPVDAPPCREVMANDFPGQRRALHADCTTDRPIFVPEGWVFDGDGHTIYARDPEGGRLTEGIIRVSGNGSTVRNVTVDGSGLTEPCLVDYGATSLAGVLVQGSGGEVTGVTVRNLVRALPAGSAGDEGVMESCGEGITVEGSTAEAFVVENTIQNGGLAGILINGSTASISNNTIDRVAETGILAMNGANVRVSPGNNVTNGQVGIHFEDSGTGGRIAGNTIESMSLAGIAVILDARATVAGNTVEDALYGSFTASRGAVDIRGNTILRAQDSGMLVDGVGTQATIEENTIDSSALDGIWVQEGARASIIGNTVEKTGRNGITAIGQGTRATLDGNTVTDAGLHGIWVGIGSTAVVSGNTVTDAAEDGILVTGGADASIGENRVAGGQRGINAGEAGTTATITSNTVEHSGVVGITINQGAAAPDVSGNTVSDARFGIVTLGAGTISAVSNNTVSDLSGSGFTVEDGATAELRGNHVSDVRLGAYVTSAGTTAKLTENRIERTSLGGIIVDDGAQATVTGNTLLQPGTNGIDIDDAGLVHLEGNTIKDARGDGIRLERVRPTTVTGDSVELVSHDIYYEPNEITIPAGTDVTLILPNEGAATHNVTIDALGIDVDIAAGATEEVVINAPAGTYEIYCGVLGHREAGQVAELLVAPGVRSDASAEPAEADVIRDNEISGGENGVVVTGFGATVAVTENAIAGVSGTGIAIESGADATIEGNTITEAATGITLNRVGASASLVGNRIFDTTERGIFIQSGAEATVQKNFVTRAGTDGIVVNGRGTTATVAGNTVSSVAGSGIVVEAAATATIEGGNTIVGGRWGINILSDGTTAEVRGNRVRGANNQSIAVLYGAKATIADNSVSGGDSGIYVRFARSRAIVTSNFVSAERQGIYIWEQAIAERIAGNSVTGSSSGIVIDGTGVRAVVEDNSVSSFAREGIAVRDGATAEVTGNRVQRNRGTVAWGVIVAGSGAAATVTNNEVSEIDGIGIQVGQGAAGTVRNNRVSTITNTGIRVMDAPRGALVIANTLREAGTIGIEARLSEVAIQDNTVEGSSYAGIQLGVDVDAEVTGNTIVGPAEPNADDPGPYGIHIQRDANGFVTDNRISDVVNEATGAACAIRIDAAAPDIRVADNVFPAPGNDQDVCDERIAEPGATPAPAATPIAATPLADDLLVPSATGREGL
jgi:probable HAF family extracellular repeat protein